MKPRLISRDDLLSDARFWAIVYESWVEAYVGDPFEDGAEYFLSVSGERVEAFWHELERVPLGPEEYPDYSVLFELSSGRKVGIVLSFYPEDFQVQDVVVLPGSSEPVVFGINGGNCRLPALRWDELLALRDRLTDSGERQKALLVLLLYPGVCFTAGDDVESSRRILAEAWKASGLSAPRIAEFVARVTEAHRDDCRWTRDPQHGWVNDARHSLRNPADEQGREVVSRLGPFFAGLS
jgi:hypothetical protein